MFFNKKQYYILSERYLECLLGDFSSLIWMIGQSPLIAGLIILRWKSWQATETLYFVIALSCVWFGCINACREIAKEKSILKRERLFGINSTAYLLSKVKILSLVGLIETGIFFFLLNHYLVLDLTGFLSFLCFFELYFSGMTLGLLLSRWCGNVNNAVISVPIAILPQIVFSKFILPENSLKGAALKIEQLMIVKWGFEALKASKKAEIDLSNYLISMILLFALGILFLFLTLGHLCMVSDE